MPQGQERLDRARRRLGKHHPRYRVASEDTIALRSALAEQCEQLLRRARQRLSAAVFDAADTDRSGSIDRREFEQYLESDPCVQPFPERTRMAISRASCDRAARLTSRLTPAGRVAACLRGCCVSARPSCAGG